MATTESLNLAQQLYVSYYGRPADPAGLEYWAGIFDGTDDLTQALNAFGTSAEYTANFGSMTNEQLVNNLYQQMFGRSAETAGLDYYVDRLDTGASTLAEIAKEIADGATDGTELDLTTLNNKIAVANTYTAKVSEIGAEYDSDDIDEAQDILGDVDSTDASVTAGNAAAVAEVESNLPAGDTFVLTNGSDEATANIFDAPMVYTPDGSDRILSLQDEDTLTGTEGRTDNTLNAEIGQINADEGTSIAVTPELNNIQVLNLDWTGSTTTVDLRYSDSVDTLNINKITADANTVLLDNITTVADTLLVSNVYNNDTTVTFDYVRGVLDGTDETMNLTLDTVLMESLTTQADGGALNEGFETVELDVANGVDIRTALSIEDMEYLNITGDGYLDILNQVWTASEYWAFSAALVNGGSIGQRTINAEEFTGELNIDISLNVGRNVDPGNSGAPYYGVTTGGSGDDTFHTNVGITSLDTDTVHNMIDGGLGDNTLVIYNGSIDDGSDESDNDNIAEITNIQNLEIRDQAAIGTIDFDAFDSELTSVFMRDEDAGATTFDLDDVGADLAADGLTLAHSISAAAAQTVDVELKDATGADDTVALTVVNDLNTGNTFDYTLTAYGYNTDTVAAGTNTGVAATSDADMVENITIHDNDTESNIVTLTHFQTHTGTTLLDGGNEGDTFTIANTLNSATVDASAQVSDLRLTVGDTVGTIETITQDVQLGTGDDVLTFANIDELDSTDSLTDAGGDDTVRAAFSEDSTLDIDGIENLHITATANVTLNMAAADVTNLVLLSNTAVDNTAGAADLDANGVQEPFGIVSSAPASVITIDSSNLTDLNYFADLDTDDSGDTGAGINDDNSTAHTFNGVTLANNSDNDITVNINSSLDFVDIGATSYTLGQITTHGNTSLDIIVSDEDEEIAVTAATARTAGNGTTIQNIYAKTMTTLTATAWGNLTLGTVSGGALNNTLTTADFSQVGGDVTANIISLGNDAVVTLADGDNIVSALGSAGKDVTITAGDGDNTITGTAQDDTITAGSGWDTINGDRGDNIITAGAGNDTVTGKDGNDTYDVGTGIDMVQDNYATAIDASLATNTVSLSGGITTVGIDVNGVGGAAGLEVDQVLAVGDGSALTISWVGAAMQTATAVLDGTAAQVVVAGANTEAMTAGSDLIILTTGAAAETIGGSAGNDVVMFTGSAAGDGLTFAGGDGNDAAIGSINVDEFTGGAGADIYAMADVAAADANSDVINIADGDSTASGWDQVYGFDFTNAAGATAVAVAGAATAGDDVLNLDTTNITAYVSPALTTNVDTNDGTVTVNGMNIDAAGLLTFDDTTAGAAVTAIGTGDGQVSLADALATLATELNGTGDTVVFAYDANGNGAVDAGVDSTVVFQDGVNDTVVQLVGTTGVTGLDAALAGGDTLVAIA